MGGPPSLLLRSDQPPEVPRRARIARRPRRRQQPLRRDPALGGLHPRTDQLDHPVVVPPPRLALRPLPAGLVPLNHPPHRLGCRGAHLGSAAVAAHLAVGGDDVHPFPRRLQWSPLGGAVTGWHRHRYRSGSLPADTTARGGDFYLATSEDLDLATSEDFFMATDTGLVDQAGRQGVFVTVDPEEQQHVDRLLSTTAGAGGGGAQACVGWRHASMRRYRRIRTPSRGHATDKPRTGQHSREPPPKRPVIIEHVQACARSMTAVSQTRMHLLLPRPNSRTARMRIRFQAAPLPGAAAADTQGDPGLEPGRGRRDRPAPRDLVRRPPRAWAPEASAVATSGPCRTESRPPRRALRRGEVSCGRRTGRDVGRSVSGILLDRHQPCHGRMGGVGAAHHPFPALPVHSRTRAGQGHG